MPIYQLNQFNLFPPVDQAEDGILAIGGDLSPERLLKAYSSGIFPWFSRDEPIIWWAPNPRCILYPNKLKVSKSMRQLLRKEPYSITFDTSFEDVMRSCSRQNRERQEGTWITEDMIIAYIKLYELGWAHSVEVWNEQKLIGGLYGVSIGATFFGESMFYFESNASKYGFIHLVDFLKKHHIGLIDCQVETDHLISLGAELISRNTYMDLLTASLSKQTLQGRWKYPS